MNNHKKNQMRNVIHIMPPRNRDFCVYTDAISMVISSWMDLHYVVQNP